MEIKHGIVTKIYPTDCAYNKVIVEDRVMVIGNSASAGNPTISEIVLPESIVELGDFAFLDCTNLEAINIPSGLKRIGERCFSNCKKLKKIVLPEGLTTIGDGAFNGCENLEEIVLPSTLKEIPSRAFAGCKKLKNIIIPSRVEKIEWGAFVSCESLESVIIPENVTTLGHQLFLHCKNLKNIQLPSSLTKLPIEIFKGCRLLEEIKIPESVIEIGDGAFCDCKILKIFPRNANIFGQGAFKNCRRLNNIVINPKTSSLPDSMFEGCISLNNITCDNKLEIGKRTFRSCINMNKIPSFVKNYDEFAFENCLKFEEVELIGDNIPKGTFRGCQNLKNVINSSNIISIGAEAFAECTNLEEFTCSKLLTKIPTRAFKRCKKLSYIELFNGIKSINNEAFFGCENLKSISLPESLTAIGSFALKNCNSISEIYIPSKLEEIATGAFSYMSSLEGIMVSKKNQIYTTIDNLSLINCQHQSLIQYAIGSKNKTFSILPFTWQLDSLGGRELIRSLERIDEFAFAGANYLEELTLDTSVMELEESAFLDCNKLKTLYIKRIPLFSSQGFKVTNHKISSWDSGDFPFESVYLDNDIQMITTAAYSGFKRLKKVGLPKKGPLFIKSQAFINCSNLEEIDITSNVCHIDDNAFNKKTLLKFDNGIEITNETLKSLGTKNATKIYNLVNGYYLERNGNIVSISYSDIERICSNAKLVINEPEAVLNYVTLLSFYNKDFNYLRNGIFIMTFNDLKTNVNLSALKSKQEDDHFQLIEPLKKEPKQDKKIIKRKYALENPDEIMEFISKQKNLKEIDSRDFELRGMASFSSIFNEFSMKDAELFIKYFDNNTMRMVKLSKVLNNIDTAVDNMKDLIKLAKVLGVFEENAVIRQRACTFINDRMFTDNFEGQHNFCKIIGDDIHRIFGELKPRDDFNQEFVDFFMNNYQNLCDEESTNSGFICDVYNNFIDISKKSTADKGLQRHLLVTLEKCHHYLESHIFDGVTEETEELARILGKWFTQNEAFKNAIIMVNEAKTAPRNIFAKFTYDDELNIVFDNSSKNDLKEAPNNNFSFEWLPKQDYKNLLLGKYCTCCAHVNGPGMGITRASMITMNHQNLIIRNANNEIIAKSTIYINREKGYAVFNNIEASIMCNDDGDKSKIYRAFMRGAKSFLEAYNTNNPNNPIMEVTIGTSRNAVIDILDKKISIHKKSDILPVPRYGDWSLNGYGSYAGDSSTDQRLVLRVNKKSLYK